MTLHRPQSQLSKNLQQITNKIFAKNSHVCMLGNSNRKFVDRKNRKRKKEKKRKKGRKKREREKNPSIFIPKNPIQQHKIQL